MCVTPAAVPGIILVTFGMMAVCSAISVFACLCVCVRVRVRVRVCVRACVRACVREVGCICVKNKVGYFTSFFPLDRVCRINELLLRYFPHISRVWCTRIH